MFYFFQCMYVCTCIWVCIFLYEYGYYTVVGATHAFVIHNRYEHKWGEHLG